MHPSDSSATAPEQTLHCKVVSPNCKAMPAPVILTVVFCATFPAAASPMANGPVSTTLSWYTELTLSEALVPGGVLDGQ
jgi:hypothetical protein